MSLIQSTIDEFAKTIGIDGLPLNESGVTSLDFESYGTLFLEPLEDSILLYLVTEQEQASHQALRTALELCHWENQHDGRLNAAIDGRNRLIFSVTLQASEFNLPALEQMIRRLGGLHDEVKAGSIE